ncbi:nitrate- and nitrite sensing domain-containing protein [Streptomyces sp. 7N604]|uniref:nitrate- and nitrite sensing domain-containing protein n=1 Tax=Streptomyces sp. 7N604 TaxID=3457415 RepID=UPI003FD69A6B
MRNLRPRGIKRRSAKPAGGASDGSAPPTPPPPQRTALVRNRLVVAVAVVAVAVLSAAAPGVAAASADLAESQRLVSLSEVNGQAVVLAHSLADERDTMTEFVAAGRDPASGAKSVSESRRTRVDRKISEIRGDAPAELRRVLAGLPKVRQEALSGRGNAMDTFEAYTEAVQALHAVSADLARLIPPRASDGPAESLPALGRAVEQGSATRGLLLGAFSGRSSRSQLSAVAQRTHVQEQAALADFEQTAPEAATDRYANTVNGTEAGTAERYLTRLTDQPQLSAQEVALNKDRVETALSGRLDRMRAVESALTTAETDRLAALRDDDVTALELRIALSVVCLLLAVGICISAARSMTRPLAVLRLGARRVADDPAAEEPVRFTGRNDEFADVVRAVNELHQTAVRLHARAEQLGDDRTRLIGERTRLAEERDELQRKQEEIADRLAGVQDRVHGSYISLALRTLGLVERQLSVIEGLEDREQEPERLDTLFKLDHLATRMRRYSENLLVLAGAEHGGWHGGGHGGGGAHGGAPVPLLDVMRAAVSEIERYERVEIHSLPAHAQVAGFAADAMSHLVAELLENATAFSPPDANVELSGWLLQSGEIMLSVQDEGIGMTSERLEELNSRLAETDPDLASGDEDDGALGLGLYVVARLAARHGVRVQLRAQKSGGVAAVAVLPKSILPTRPAPAGAGGPGATTAAPGKPAVNFPGSVAEANSNALPTRTPALRGPQPLTDGTPADGASPEAAPMDAAPEADPLVAAAERAIAAEEATEEATEGEPPAAAEPTNAALADETIAAAAPDGPDATATFPLPSPPDEAVAEPVAEPQAVLPERSVARAEADGEYADAVESAASDEIAAAPPGTPGDEPGSVPDVEQLAPGDAPLAPSADVLGAPAGEPFPAAPEEQAAPAAEPQAVLPEQPVAPADADGASAGADALGASDETAASPLGAAGESFPAVPEQGGPAALRPEAPVAPAAGGPYAMGPDEHAHAEDEANAIGATATGAIGVDQATQDLRQPPAADYPDGPTVHGTGATALPEATPAAADAAQPAQDDAAPRWDRVTDKGLPKRTPKNLAPTAPASERTAPVNAEELRRRLGRFQQGARDGRRDAEMEFAGREDTAQQPQENAAEESAQSAERSGEHQTGALDETGTVEEARG